MKVVWWNINEMMVRARSSEVGYFHFKQSSDCGDPPMYQEKRNTATQYNLCRGSGIGLCLVC